MTEEPPEHGHFELIARRQLHGEEALQALSEADRRGLIPAEASNLLASLVTAGTPAQETVDAVMLVLRRLYPDA